MSREAKFRQVSQINVKKEKDSFLKNKDIKTYVSVPKAATEGEEDDVVVAKKKIEISEKIEGRIILLEFIREFGNNDFFLVPEFTTGGLAKC